MSDTIHTNILKETQLLSSAVAKDVSNPYFRKGRPRTALDTFEKLWTSLFCWVPFHSTLFGSMEIPPNLFVSEKWRAILDSKDAEDRTLTCKVRGIFNLRTLLDCLTFAWTRCIEYNVCFSKFMSADRN